MANVIVFALKMANCWDTIPTYEPFTSKITPKEYGPPPLQTKTNPFLYLTSIVLGIESLQDLVYRISPVAFCTSLDNATLTNSFSSNVL